MCWTYGPRQFGTEDQGWVAHFLIRALKGEAITLFGDGFQVRDVLHVHDAVAAYLAVRGNIDRLAGRAFNLGGGPANAVSLTTVLDAIRRLTGRPVTLDHDRPRTGDQLWFVADTRRLEAETGWRRRIDHAAGLKHLHDWLVAEGGGAAAPADWSLTA
jgi:CDP-paratose 2-epimerase